MARLRKQAQNCNFAKPNVDIRDQVIDKCRSSELRKRLLAKEYLTLQKVQAVVRSMKAVDLQAKKIGAQDSTSSTEESLGVNEAVSSPIQSPPKQQKGKKRLGRCYRCGQEGHYASICKTKPGNDLATRNKSSGRKNGLGEKKISGGGGRGGHSK